MAAERNSGASFSEFALPGTGNGLALAISVMRLATPAGDTLNSCAGATERPWTVPEESFSRLRMEKGRCAALARQDAVPGGMLAGRFTIAQ